jgi:alkylated DNA repair dioxygenase AlkB
MKIHLTQNAFLSIYDNWQSEADSSALMEHIQKELTLVHNPEAVLREKSCVIHRDIGFFTDASVDGYRYPGYLVVSQPLTLQLQTILQTVNEFTRSDFNAILLNRYNSNTDYMSAHSEPTLGSVFSLSLSSKRIVRIREKATKRRIQELVVTNGQLLGMCGPDFQRLFTHEVPSSSREEPSICVSLTFLKQST